VALLGNDQEAMSIYSPSRGVERGRGREGERERFYLGTLSVTGASRAKEGLGEGDTLAIM
jgi:hypothetical protein